MSAPQSDAFAKAIVDSKKLTAKPNNDELLELYAYFKCGTGEDFAAATAPGMFDLKGKAKYNAWKRSAVEEEISCEEAQQKYVELVERLKGTYGYDENKEPEAVGN